MKWTLNQTDILGKINFLANAGCRNDECHAIIFTTEKTAEQLRKGAKVQCRFISKWESCGLCV